MCCCLFCVSFVPICEGVGEKVDEGGLALERLGDEGEEVLGGLGVAEVEAERRAQVLEAVGVRELREARRRHHAKEVDEELRVVAQHVVRAAARQRKLLEIVTFYSSHYCRHFCFVLVHVCEEESV